MASVSSLDKDLRNMRLSRYTPQAAAEVRDWVEDVLREKLPSTDLLEGLKDGVALCKLVNLAVSPGVKYKQSSMPFVQMENISHFLRACQMAPISLPPHDVFLTVDLYEAKDPAQVLQCLAAFSRRANALQPGAFPRTVGPQSKRGLVSPNATGTSSPGPYNRPGRASSNVSDTNSGRPGSQSSGSFSSWSKKDDQSKTAPAWNIHQYGYMGGASQGNQGIAFGARRQITTPGPAVPSLAEKEKRRKEEEDIIRQNAERDEAERVHQRAIEDQEARAKVEEQRRWEEETDQLREKKRREMEDEKRRWDDEKRRWEAEEQRRLAEEKATEERFEQDRQRRKSANDSRLNGQFLSQYQSGQTNNVPPAVSTEETPESRRIKELERELELAKERERKYETDRQSTEPQDENDSEPRSQSRGRPVPVPPKPSYSFSSLEQERRLLRGEWQKNQDLPSAEETTDDYEEQAPPPPPRPLPEPVPTQQQAPALPARELPPAPAPRPLPDPAAYSANRGQSRTDRFLNSNPAPAAPAPASHQPQDYSTTSEVDAENSRREASQQKTRAGGWASKSLLEREMERERERQREWEDNQKQTQAAARDTSHGSGPGQTWDVHQYGYLGGDNQNRGGTGLGIGGARRQIIGPRPPP
ncbi:Calponin domain protein [Penicillium angulare]|uniref:Calponin domain protein n=1 Tax=Penicillium angulare TaxID=116970 RepID=UPI0025423329|nr:Calponin domain protein [Penicillium angulare]KAJ5281119.1 Calponin domain protein [Penicillium angulare]